jgi:hypothetical protein
MGLKGWPGVKYCLVTLTTNPLRLEPTACLVATRGRLGGPKGPIGPPWRPASAAGVDDRDQRSDAAHNGYVATFLRLSARATAAYRLAARIVVAIA